MKIVRSDFKNGPVKIRIDDLDDLWYLSHIIEVGDTLKGKTTRKIRIGDGDNAKVVKKTLTLTIAAETIELVSATNSLRVNGKVRDGPDDIPNDSYHTISLENGSECTITKNTWRDYHRRRLHEASEQKFSYLICLSDRQEAIFAITKKFGYEVLLELQGDVVKKREENTAKGNFFDELIKTLKDYDQRYSPQAIILASPAFFKDDIAKKIIDKNIKKKLVLSISSEVSRRAIDEVLKRPELEKTLQNSRAREEQLIVDELLELISKNSKSAYGWNEVSKAVDAGAVQDLLITEKYLNSRKEAKSYQELDEKMKNVDLLKGKIHLLSSELESGKQVDGLGGVAAILRYNL
jgi:protein pelota